MVARLTHPFRACHENPQDTGLPYLPGPDPAAGHTRKKVIIAASRNYHTCNWHNRTLIRLVRDSILLAPLGPARIPANQNRFSTGHFQTAMILNLFLDILSGECVRSHVQAQGADKGCLSNISLARKEPVPAASPVSTWGLPHLVHRQRRGNAIRQALLPRGVSMSAFSRTPAGRRQAVLAQY